MSETAANPKPQETSDDGQWLIRTAENVLIGPYTKERVIALIQDRSLKLDDEICPGGGFWFYIHEREELVRQVGIEPPEAILDPDEEATQTQTQTQTQTRTEKFTRRHERDPSLPELEQKDMVREAAVLDNQAYRNPTQGSQDKTKEPESGTSPEISGRPETLTLWKVFAILLVILVVVLIVLLFRLVG